MKTKDVADLRRHLGFWMRLVSNHVSHAFARKVEATGVTVAEWVILREMFEHADPLAPSLLADRTGLTRGAVSKLVDRLVLKKLILRKDLTEDRRYQEIRLSQKGLDLVPRLAKLADENDEEFFQVLTKDERQVLKGLLHKLAEKNELRKLPTD